MKSSVLAIRSIGAEFAKRIYIGVAILFVVVAAIVLGTTAWLASLNVWWWLLFAALAIFASIGLGILVVVGFIIKSVTPMQSKAQKAQAKSFVDKLQNLSETAQTPRLILLFRIIRDIARPREQGFISTLSSETTSLKSDFVAFSKTFKDQ